MKVFELAERLGGMTAYELMNRMSLPEILEWIEFDQCHHSVDAQRWALMYLKMDFATWDGKGRKPKIENYLKPIKKRGRQSWAEKQKRWRQLPYFVQAEPKPKEDSWPIKA